MTNVGAAALTLLGFLVAERPCAAAWKLWRASPAGSCLVLHTAAVPPFSLAWERTLPEPLLGSALIAQGRAYLVNESYRVAALDLRTGDPAWSFDSPTDPAEAVSLDAAYGRLRWRRMLDAKVVDVQQAGSGVMLVGTEAGSVYALWQEDGRIHWRTPLEPPLTQAAYDAELAVVGSGQAVEGLAMATGKRLFRSDLGDRTGPPPALAPEGVYAATERELLALDRKGILRWRRLIPGRPTAPLALTLDGVLTGGRDGTVTLRRRGDGAELWRRTLSGAVTAFAVEGHMVYAGTAEGRISCLLAQGGSLLWSVRLDEHAARPISGLAISDRRLVANAGAWCASLLASPAPPPVTLGRIEPGRFVLSWEAARENGSPISAYLIWRRPARGAWAVAAIAGASARELTLPPALSVETFAVSALAEDGGRSERGPEAAADAVEPLLSRLMVSPQPFLVGEGELTAAFDLRDAATVRWIVTDLDDRPVTEERTVFLARGPASVRWDGRDRFGTPAAVGTYKVVVRASTGPDSGTLARAAMVGWWMAPPGTGGRPAPVGTPPPALASAPVASPKDAPVGAAATGDHGDRGVRDHGIGEGRDAHGQGKGRGLPHGEKGP